MNIGLIGYGYWGPNLVRNFISTGKCKVKKVCDLRNERLQALKKVYPDIETTNDYNEIINDSSIDGVLIATPVFTHFDLALKALNAKKHVLIEKPMTSTVEESEKLIDLAGKKSILLMVDQTYLYTGAVQKIKSLIDKNEIGKAEYFDSTRINLGLFQPDINVLWDLAPHDISILNYIISEVPYSVIATGTSHTKNNIENIAYLTVNYKSGFIAHFNCSWSSPVKIRLILIGGDKKMIVFNDLEPTEKIKIYDTGYEHKTDEDKRKILVDYRVGDIFVPKVQQKEALAGMAEDFINSIENGKQPLSTAISGLEVIRILEASQKSIKNHGREEVL